MHRFSALICGFAVSLVTFEGHAETPRPAVVETERAERTVEDVPRVGLTPRPAPGQNENRSPWGKKWARNPRGPIFNLHLGFALPIGQRALHFPTGFRIGFSAGYEFRFKRFHFGTLSPLVHVSYTRWGRVAGTLSMQAGARFDHYIPRGRIKWNLWFHKKRKMAHWNARSFQCIERTRERLTPLLLEAIPLSCRHLRGRGSVKGAIRTLTRCLGEARYVARFDIKSYYKSMRHDVLLALLRDAGADAHSQAVVSDYLRLPDIHHTGQGMVASGSLSPLLGGLYLAPLDRAMEGLQTRHKLVCTVRFMDDIVLLARTRWNLRHAIAELHAVLRPLCLRLHRTKRFIGKTTHGFDFLGFQLHPGRKLRPSRESLRRLRERARRLYEREGDIHRLRRYVARWWHWLHGGLDGLVSRQGGYSRLTKHILSHLQISRPRGRDG